MLEYLLKLGLLSIGITGVWLFSGKWIKDYLTANKRSKKIKVRIGKATVSSNTKSRDHPLIKKAELIIGTAHSNKIEFETYVFMLLMIIVFSILFLYGTNNFSFMNFLFSLILALFPVGFTLTKFYFARLEASYEGERLIIEFINQYNLNGGNVLETIDRTARSLKDEIHSKIALSRLYFNLNNARNENEIHTALNEFSFSINTQWANLLAHNIFSALVLGVSIHNSLDDILQEVKFIRNSIEKSKRENNEGFSIAIFLAPAIYVVTTFYGIKAIDISFNEYLKNQFTTAIGYRLFIIILVLFFFCLVMAKVLKKPKFD